MNWSRQNDALLPIANTMISTSNVVERPKGEPPRLSATNLAEHHTVGSHLQQQGALRVTNFSTVRANMNLNRTMNTSCGFILILRSKFGMALLLSATLFDATISIVATGRPKLGSLRRRLPVDHTHTRPAGSHSAPTRATRGCSKMVRSGACCPGFISQEEASLNL